MQANPWLVGADIVARGYALQNQAPRVEHWFRQLIEGLRPDVVHFHHLAGWGSFHLPAIAAETSAVVMTLHDEYLICPLFRLGGACTKEQCIPDDECMECIKGHMDVGRVTPDSEVFNRVQNRHFSASNALLSVNRCIVPSKSLQDRIYAAGYHVPMTVIPHGSAHLTIPHELRQPAPRLRVAWVGLASAEKGWAAFYEVAIQGDPRFELHVIGYVDPSCQTWGLEQVKFHGAYDPEDLALHLQQVDIVIPACMRSESYGIVVDEAIQAGCRVILPRVQALLERVSDPMSFDWGDAQQLLNALELCTLDDRIPSITLPTLEDTARRHLDIYREVIR